MMEELYSYDRHRGHDIYITIDNGFFYGDIYFNGTCMTRNIKGLSASKCLTKCQDSIDAVIHYETKEQD